MIEAADIEGDVVDPADMAEIERRLADPLWRICSGEIYEILTSDGRGLIPFHPRPEQITVAERILGRKWDPVSQSSAPAGEPCKRLLIPKARRLGMSTIIGVMMADSMMWNPDYRATVIDQNAGDAERKLAEIIAVAVESVRKHPLFAGLLKIIKDNNSSLVCSFSGHGHSQCAALAGARGGTNNFLWISEWGVIQHEDPKRSAKIRSGALPSARHGVTIVETTWAGGKIGDLWELIAPVISGESDDWEVLFFPWYVDPRNVHETAVIDGPTRKYREKIQKRLDADGIVITEAQWRWYAMERRTQGIFMMRENPTFIDECWSAPVKGAIYAAEIDQAHGEGRIAFWPVDPSCLVHCAADLGSPANTVFWYFQLVGPMLRIVDVDAGLELTSAERWAWMQAKPFGRLLGQVFLPHDAASKNATGESPVQSFAKAGMKQIRIVPRTHDVWVGINALKELFPLIQFNESTCGDAVGILGSYHTRTAKDGVATVDEPVHDASSHYADGLRYIAEAIRSGMIKFAYGPGRDPANVRPFERTGSVYDEKQRRRLPMRVGG